LEVDVTVIPDVDVELPSGWSWTEREQSPLTMAPAHDDAALQFSSPPAAAAWRGADPREVLRELVVRAASTFGELVELKAGDVAYGGYAHAECKHDTFGDVCLWLLLPETHDPLLITWIATARNDAGTVARQIVDTIRPGLFSASVAMAVAGARGELAESGTVSAITLLVGDGTITNVMLPFDDDALAVQAIRYEREQNSAKVIAQIQPATARGPDGASEEVVSIYVESATRRKRFVMPLATAATHEIEGDAPICNLFEAVDPALIPMFQAARR
jgi:hypothetical protein